MSVPIPRYLWKPMALAAALAFLYASVLWKLGFDWWIDPNYSHGLLVPFIITFILWNGSRHLRRLPVRPSLLWGGGASEFYA